MQSCEALPPMSSHTLSLFCLLATCLLGGTAHYRARLRDARDPVLDRAVPRPPTPTPTPPTKPRKANKRAQPIVEVELDPLDGDDSGPPTREVETNLEHRANVWEWRGEAAGEPYDVEPDELDRHLAARSSHKASAREESGTRRGGGASATTPEKQTGAMSSGTGHRGNVGRVWHAPT